MTAIGDQAFIKCTGLESVVIPDSVTTIETNAFSYCEGLKNVSISNNVTSLKQQVFCECTSFETETFQETSKIKSIGYSAFGGLPFIKM